MKNSRIRRCVAAHVAVVAVLVKSSSDPKMETSPRFMLMASRQIELLPRRPEKEGEEGEKGAEVGCFESVSFASS